MHSKKHNEKSKLVEVKNLKKYFPIRKGLFSKVVGNVKAVDDVSFEIIEGETLGLVGESGCGKTTVGRTLLKLINPTSGSVFFNRKKISDMKSSQLRPYRRQMQIIFQDPYSSLNPRMTIGNMLEEVLKVHRIVPKNFIEKEVLRLLDVVGLSKTYYNRYPHEFSGGQRQRVGIARALSVRPKLIVCDEAVSALDVSIQAQVINLLKDLQKEYNLTYLFISHDLSVVEYISDRVAVMYAGKIQEIADCNDLFSNPLNPYTKALLNSIPKIGEKKKKKNTILLKSIVSSANKEHKGCSLCERFNPSDCACGGTGIEPDLNEVKDNHFVRCNPVILGH